MTTAAAPTLWRIDPVHTTIEFAVTHMPFSLYHARFRQVEGTITLDEAQPERSTVTATIAADSIDVLGERFLAVMQNEEFFHTEKYPSITFQSTAVERADDNHWLVTGDLTIRDVTRSVTLRTSYAGRGKHPVSGRILAGFHAETAIDREDFGLRYNRLLETGGAYLGTQVTITLDIEAVQQDEPSA